MKKKAKPNEKQRKEKTKQTSDSSIMTDFFNTIATTFIKYLPYLAQFGQAPRSSSGTL